MAVNMVPIGSTNQRANEDLRNWEQDKMKMDISEAQNRRAQTQQDYAVFANIRQTHQGTMDELALKNPKAVPSYFQKLKENNQSFRDALERQGISNMEAIVAPSGKVGIEMTVPINDNLKNKIKSQSGLDVPDNVTEAIVMSDGKGGTVIKAGNAAMKDEKYERGKYVSKLRKDFQSSRRISSIIKLEAAYTKMNASLDKARAAEKAGNPYKSYAFIDQALITLFNKMNDEDSVVRESEYARSEKSGSVESQLEATKEKLIKGGVLNAQERDALINEARVMYESVRELARKDVQVYHNEANEYGIDPSRVIGGFEDLLESKQSDPTPPSSPSQPSQPSQPSEQSQQSSFTAKDGQEYRIVYKDGKAVGRVPIVRVADYDASEVID